MIDYFARRGDTLAPLEAALTNADGTPVDLTGATVAFQLRSAVPGADAVIPLGGTLTVLPVVPPATVPNVVHVAWGPTDLQTPGRFYADWQVTWGPGTSLTLPTIGHTQLHVLDDIA